MRWTAGEVREDTAWSIWLKYWDFNAHLKEGERRMRLRGREGMVMVVKDREEEGKGLSENLVKM